MESLPYYDQAIWLLEQDINRACEIHDQAAMLSAPTDKLNDIYAIIVVLRRHLIRMKEIRHGQLEMLKERCESDMRDQNCSGSLLQRFGLKHGKSVPEVCNLLSIKVAEIASILPEKEPSYENES